MLIGRWGRARRWLERAAGKRGPGELRLLDVGCAFGFGTAMLAGSGAAGWIAGVEPDPEYVRRARRDHASAAFVRGCASPLPVAGGSVDVVLLLDVIEHLANPQAAVAEARRVLRPGGQLLLSVPHRGALAAVDALNLYAALRRHWRSLPAPEAGEASAGGRHRHFSLGEVQELLAPHFAVEGSAATGLGLAEVVHFALLVVCRGVLRSERLYRALSYAYYTVYLVEDCLPAGRAGYHLFVQARLTATDAASV